MKKLYPGDIVEILHFDARQTNTIEDENKTAIRDFPNRLIGQRFRIEEEVYEGRYKLEGFDFGYQKVEFSSSQIDLIRRSFWRDVRHLFWLSGQAVKHFYQFYKEAK